MEDIVLIDVEWKEATERISDDFIWVNNNALTLLRSKDMVYFFLKVIMETLTI